MPGQPSRMGGVKGDECDCGRRKSIRHCPTCGSARLYAFADRIVVGSKGNELVTGWNRCMSCGRQFHEREREFCDAPPFTAQLARLKAQRLAEAASENEYLEPEVIAKAQELAGQKVDPLIQEMCDHEEGTIDFTPRSDEDVEALVENQKLIDKNKTMSTAEALLRREWANIKINNDPRLPDVNVYIKRRMSGETTEAILGE